jgi:hypothetical protein
MRIRSHKKNVTLRKKTIVTTLYKKLKNGIISGVDFVNDLYDKKYEDYLLSRENEIDRLDSGIESLEFGEDDRRK